MIQASTMSDTSPRKMKQMEPRNLPSVAGFFLPKQGASSGKVLARKWQDGIYPDPTRPKPYRSWKTVVDGHFFETVDFLPKPGGPCHFFAISLPKLETKIINNNSMKHNPCQVCQVVLKTILGKKCNSKN